MPPLALACAAAAHTYQPNAPLHAATHERQCHVAIPRHTRYMSVLPAAVVLLLMSWRRWHVVQPTPHMLHTCAPCCLPCRSHPAVHELAATPCWSSHIKPQPHYHHTHYMSAFPAAVIPLFMSGEAVDSSASSSNVASLMRYTMSNIDGGSTKMW